MVEEARRGNVHFCGFLFSLECWAMVLSQGNESYVGCKRVKLLKTMEISLSSGGGGVFVIVPECGGIL